MVFNLLHSKSGKWQNTKKLNQANLTLMPPLTGASFFNCPNRGIHPWPPDSHTRGLIFSLTAKQIQALAYFLVLCHFPDFVYHKINTI